MLTLERAKELLSQMIADPQAQKLVQQLGGSHGRNG